MSVQAISWVLEHSPSEGSDRLVLISLANHAGQSPVDGAWESYPGIETIRRESGLRRQRTVQDALARLEKSGAIVRKINGAPDARIRGDRRPNLYQIVIPDDGVTASDTPPPSDGVTPDAARGDVSRRDGVTRNVTQTVIEPSVEPKTAPTLPLEPSVEPAARPPGDLLEADFDDWYSGYPLKKSKAAARKAYKTARAKTDAATLLLARDAFAKLMRAQGTERRFIKHPSTWLNQECWADELDDPENLDGHFDGPPMRYG